VANKTTNETTEQPKLWCEPDSTVRLANDDGVAQSDGINNNAEYGADDTLVTEVIIIMVQMYMTTINNPINDEPPPPTRGMDLIIDINRPKLSLLLANKEMIHLAGTIGISEKRVKMIVL
jgi:hypothetical protein